MSLTTNLKSKLSAPLPNALSRNERLCNRVEFVDDNCYTTKRTYDDYLPDYVSNQEVFLYLVIMAVIISTVIALITAAVNEFLTHKRELELKRQADQEGASQSKANDHSNDLAMLECYEDDCQDDAIWLDTLRSNMPTELSTITLVPADDNEQSQTDDDEAQLSALARANISKQWSTVVRRNKAILKHCFERGNSVEACTELQKQQVEDTADWKDMQGIMEFETDPNEPSTSKTQMLDSMEIEMAELFKDYMAAEFERESSTTLTTITVPESASDVSETPSSLSTSMNNDSMTSLNASEGYETAASTIPTQAENAVKAYKIVGASEEEIDA